jgi:hypothetical protein
VGATAGAVHETRRQSGARHEISKRVAVKRLGAKGGDGVPSLEGWALNISRGGLRVILEEKVEPGDDVEVALLDSSADGGPSSGSVHVGRVVWVQEEHDGVVAGIAFANATPSSPPPPVAPTG